MTAGTVEGATATAGVADGIGSGCGGGGGNVRISGNVFLSSRRRKINQRFKKLNCFCASDITNRFPLSSAMRYDVLNVFDEASNPSSRSSSSFKSSKPIDANLDCRKFQDTKYSDNF